MNRKEKRATAKLGITDPKTATNAHRVLSNVLTIIDTAQFVGARNAPLIIEAFQFVESLMKTLPIPANAPTPVTGEAILEAESSETPSDVLDQPVSAD